MKISDPSYNENIDFTKTQLGVLLVAMLLAVDAINPVKIILHVFPWMLPWHIVVVCMGLSSYIWISEFKNLLYFSVTVFFQSILSIFFRQVEIIGRHNIPQHGPIIFTINHANQFMDAVTTVCTCPHKISYLMAEASWNRRIVGDLAWALDVVPVKRAQDSSIAGQGTIVLDVNDSKQDSWKVHGQDTKFTQQLAVGDKIRPPKTAATVKVVEIVNDKELTVDASLLSPEDQAVFQTYNIAPGVSFDILKRVDQKVVYEKVLDKLASGGCIGIFPEGGSHDRTDLLPLKVGVALIAYEALDKDTLNVPIVPVGLNYFQAHRWRGRAVVEYGRPIYLDPTTLPSYKQGGAEKRRVCNELLDQIQDSMKSVIVSTPDYDTLQLIHTARRLYQRRGLRGKEKQDLSRRFAEGYKRLLTMVNGEPPKAWLELQKRVVAYQQELRDLGIRDYQVPGLDRTLDEDSNLKDINADKVLQEIRLPYQIVHLVLLLFLAMIPTLFLNLPVGIMAGLYAERRRKKALARSKVKIRAYDVMLTEKVIFCIVFIPLLWISYGLALMLLTDFDGPTIALMIMSMPLFAYVGIIVSDAGVIELKDLRPYLMRLIPSSRRRLKKLPAIRRQLQIDIRAFIKKLGPKLGELYFDKELDWKEIVEETRRSSVIAMNASAAAKIAGSAAKKDE